MASKEKHRPSYNEPFRGTQWLEPEQCKKCVFRDRATAELDGKVIPVGATRSSCELFPYPDMKPGGVLHNTEKCKHYVKEALPQEE